MIKNLDIYNELLPLKETQLSWIYDKNPTHLAHVFLFIGETFKGKMNESVTKTREPNVCCSYHIICE